MNCHFRKSVSGLLKVCSERCALTSQIVWGQTRFGAQLHLIQSLKAFQTANCILELFRIMPTCRPSNIISSRNNLCFNLVLLCLLDPAPAHVTDIYFPTFTGTPFRTNAAGKWAWFDLRSCHFSHNTPLVV